MDNFNNILYQARFHVKTNWLKAIKILEDALEEHPNSEELLLEIADIYHQRGLVKKTLQYYQKVFKIDESHPLARFRSGNIYLELHEPKLAIYHYDKIKEDYPEALYNKAIAYRNMQKPDEAVKILKNLVEHPVKMLCAYKYLVEILLMFRKSKEAFKYIDDAIMAFGKSPTTHYLKGLTYSQERNYIAAYTEYLQAAKDDYEHPHIHTILAKTAELIGLLPNALRHLKEAIRCHNVNSGEIYDLVEFVIRHNIINNKEELTDLLNEFDDITISSILETYQKVLDNKKKHAKTKKYY
ncbi:MAG: tetratricopeptide repeat protein [Candidatus Cloacimonetes bacterium]|nr:tetratricopeptide repeat protein [Candidatus Cloacimonadota bacterium]